MKCGVPAEEFPFAWAGGGHKVVFPFLKGKSWGFKKAHCVLSLC